MSNPLTRSDLQNLIQDLQCVYMHGRSREELERKCQLCIDKGWIRLGATLILDDVAPGAGYVQMLVTNQCYFQGTIGNHATSGLERKPIAER